MTVPGNIDALLLGGQRGYQIERSLRFNSADSAYLNRTLASAGNRQAWTWSAWMKLSDVSTSAKTLFQADTASVDALQIIDAKLDITLGAVNFATTAVYRDPSAWYHIVWNYNGSTTVVYVNNVSAGSAAKTGDTKINNNIVHYIGTNSTARYFSGYLTEIHFIDGQALTPSSFGETDTITGVWKPKKYAGTYGTNGFYLKFADNSGTTSTTLGKDSSGNGNNWTPNNFSVTAGAGNDSMIDTPTPYADGGNGRGNYCTLNPLYKLDSGTTTFTNGNLEWSNSSAGADGYFAGTQLITAGKYYYEATVVAVGQGVLIGVCRDTTIFSTSNEGAYRNDSSIYNLSGSAQTSGSTYTTNDVIGVAVDISAGTVQFYKNNVAQGATPSFTFTAGTPLVVRGRSNGNGASLIFNFGQRAFAYTPPSGFKALNTQNLPEPSIKKPSSYMDVKLYTGNGGTQTISGLGFSPDLAWLKQRSAGGASHRLIDTVRGANKELYSDLTNAEFTDTDSLTAFTSDGFSLGAESGINNNGSTYVAWCWDESATPGFDIVTYTGTGSATTVAHNLGVAPKMIIAKNRTSASSWDVYHIGLTSANYRVQLNSTGAESVSNGSWNGTAPTSTVFSVKDDTATNSSGASHVAYLWSEVAGFSKFGSYTGNGSTDGPFVFTGMRPRWLLIKRTDAADNWMLLDAARSTYNTVNAYLYPDSSAAEATPTAYVDFLSNGFKLRNSDSGRNASGGTYIFAAFAESPFKYSLAR